jgi:hypothetical protein
MNKVFGLHLMQKCNLPTALCIIVFNSEYDTLEYKIKITSHMQDILAQPDFCTNAYCSYVFA